MSVWGFSVRSGNLGSEWGFSVRSRNLESGTVWGFSFRSGNLASVWVLVWEWEFGVNVKFQCQE